MRHIDEQGRFISQVELCAEHVRLAIVGNIKIHDRRPKPTSVTNRNPRPSTMRLSFSRPRARGQVELALSD